MRRIQKLQDKCSQPGMVRYCLTTWQKKAWFRQEYLDTTDMQNFNVSVEINYGAAEYLYFFRVLVPATDRNALNLLCGQLTSEILMQNWDATMEDLTWLKETILYTLSGQIIMTT
ncbi:hypothetical protein QTO34_019294 [Cnephaeus nilssonii]|uniref:Uncharacterized protein n=1 Tax=Cnephaeus nilssonii TaxID=3371016 RepID=A0AA40LMK5_CNENI|nr:hypothetical protein QTO34_019294 [Eptesicus nilssonii]